MTFSAYTSVFAATSNFAPALRWLFALLSLWLLGTTPADAAEIGLAWDPVDDSRVALYEVHFGSSSGDYTAHAQTQENQLLVAGLADGQQFFFAVRACTEGATACSDFSNEVSANTPEPTQVPVAAFGANPKSGVAPLTVQFSDQSSGSFETLTWSFGDGATTSGSSPSHTYHDAGFYSVTLTATGPGGGDSVTYSDYIIVSEPPPVAAFEQSTSSGTSPVTVTFADTSTGTVDARLWELGDGSTATGSVVVHTYGVAGAYDVRLTVTGPGGSDTLLHTDAVIVQEPVVAPEAGFTADRTSGGAPLMVQFTDTSVGDVDSRLWDFGDGGTSANQHPNYNYEAPGVYSVALTVIGPGGTDMLVRAGYIVVGSELPAEAGSVEVDDRGAWVAFERIFTDPIVVAKITTDAERDPVVVRVTDVTPDGFWVKLDEWSYLDGVHAPEQVAYLAVERGVYVLDDGRWLEAGTVETDTTNKLSNAPLFAPFAEPPIILATINTGNDPEPATVRVDTIRNDGFRLGLDEQEANNKPAHAVESVAYVAIEAGNGQIGDWAYQAGRTADVVDHRGFRLEFAEAFSEPPLLLAGMQTTNDGDTAALRCQDLSAYGITIRAEEESSRSRETKHAGEQAGYLALEWLGSTP